MNVITLDEGKFQYREKLEKQALMNVCTCLYYDLADCIDGMSDGEVINIIENHYDCDMCGMKGAQS